MAAILDSLIPPSRPTLPTRFSTPLPSSASCLCTRRNQSIKACSISRRSAMALILSTCIFSEAGLHDQIAFAEQSVGFREYIDTFDGYSLKYPQNWIQVRGAGADIFFRDPFVLDENLSVEMSSPSSSRYKTVEDLGPPEEAGKKVLKQYLTEFMSTRLGVRRESNILSTSSRVAADDGKLETPRVQKAYVGSKIKWTISLLNSS
ncbi:hypothetical protein HRI_004785200 [Hibiscus trionum]|uniref:PsbP C-terminal domain-containing protein n=1 Tax=Hibiscus trionum TaxID=183268 RepID=A0A9W7JCA1_HIBTR|nr:hypothetical protein HRI_004785200 [Hibiscus trionum]